MTERLGVLWSVAGVSGYKDTPPPTSEYCVLGLRPDLNQSRIHLPNEISRQKFRFLLTDKGHPEYYWCENDNSGDDQPSDQELEVS